MHASADTPCLLHGPGHAKQTGHTLNVATGELAATKANAAKLVVQLQVKTADKQQLSIKLEDLGIIKAELEPKAPSGCCNFTLSWIQNPFDFLLFCRDQRCNNHQQQAMSMLCVMIP